MKNITLFIMLFAFTIASAQQTFELNWQQGVNGASASFTIEEGDTIEWTWSNTSPHDVVPTPEETDAPADFGSAVLQGVGQSYSYTFTEAAVIDYLCSVHPSSMFGTITVEEILSVQEKFEINVIFYPNPVSDEMTIASLFRIDTYEIYDVFGKKVGQGIGEGTYTNLNTAYLNTGVYFVKVNAGDLQTIVRLMKN
ncbi:T9SS type A sorting domain-containing protein [Patiriisocius marinus]|uniref:Uncharacterized protein n=1 Tax=Patiriisocius marinus TaxID=1397112 RepID=A0A5J4IZF2_9FLAO|nr:T9SS type A sorting domain-containing protein [Patiriisocius marinus]GER59170.1 hypothetical protein ULMA_12780 [Patiriisocius marinus]